MLSRGRGHARVGVRLRPLHQPSNWIVERVFGAGTDLVSRTQIERYGALFQKLKRLEKLFQMPNIVVLGTGMAGFGAAYRLHDEGITPVMYDKNAYHGGHTASFRYESNFVFDVGPHISFTKDPRIQDLFADSVDQQYETVQINLNNYWRGHWPRHPVQLHLHGLPEDVIVKVIADFVEERQRPERPVKNYADWLLSSFGRTFAELFPMQYTRKYHLTTAENMSTDWLGPRIYRPVSRKCCVARSRHQPRMFTTSRTSAIPRDGGFVSYLKKFVPLGNLKLNHELVSIDPRTRRLTLLERPRGALRRADLFGTAAGSRSA